MQMTKPQTNVTDYLAETFSITSITFSGNQMVFFDGWILDIAQQCLVAKFVLQIESHDTDTTLYKKGAHVISISEIISCNAL